MMVKAHLTHYLVQRASFQAIQLQDTLCEVYLIIYRIDLGLIELFHESSARKLM